MFIFWLIVVLNWIAYTVANIYYTSQNNFASLQLFTFCETTILTIFILTTSLFFFIAYHRIIQLNRQLGDREGNSRQLQKYKKYTLYASIGQFSLFLLCLWQLYTQGIYNLDAQIANVTNSTIILVVEIIFFWIMFTNNMGLKLKSQMQHDGHIFLIGIDRFGRECLRLQIDRQSRRKSRLSLMTGLADVEKLIQENVGDDDDDELEESESDVTTVSQELTPT